MHRCACCGRELAGVVHIFGPKVPAVCGSAFCLSWARDRLERVDERKQD